MSDMYTVQLRHQPSQLLSQDENRKVFSILDSCCQSTAIAVVELYQTHRPYHVQWIHQWTGVVCFVKDNGRQSFYIQLFSYPYQQLTWEQEIYAQFKYNRNKDFFHTFESDDCMVGLNFADVNEADIFGGVIEAKLRQRESKREFRRLSRQAHVTLADTAAHSGSLPNIAEKPKQKVSYLTFRKEKKKKAKKSNLKKTDFGIPIDFTHVSHVGFDPDRGFEFNKDDPNVRLLLEQAGVSENHMKDDDTRSFIYGFIGQYKSEGFQSYISDGSCEVTDSIKKKARPPVPPPPVPDRSLKSGNLRTCVLAPPPPPPPPPVISELYVSTSASPSLSASPNRSSSCDDRSLLLESIRSGTSLKPVSQDRDDSPTNSPSIPRDGIAQALARALHERSKVIHSTDTSDSDSEFDADDDYDDDDWED